MSEEQSSFKVTDRRLFNPDGTPRDIEREEEQEAKAAAPAETGGTGSPAAPEAQSSSASASATPEPETGESVDATPAAAAASSEAEPQTEDAPEGAGIPGADDPASFINFLMSIASNAASALGMMEHPVTGERGVDLQLGKHWIDILGMLQEKTRGNLHPQEQQIFEGLLADLRMQFVSLTSAPPPRTPPGGFSGRDITGGR